MERGMAYGIPGSQTTAAARLCRGVQCSREGVQACQRQSCSPLSEPQPNEEGQASGRFFLFLAGSRVQPDTNSSPR
jgi:hypothetical protein